MLDMTVIREDLLSLISRLSPQLSRYPPVMPGSSLFTIELQADCSIVSLV